MDLESSPQAVWGLQILHDALEKTGRNNDFPSISFEKREIKLADRINQQGFILDQSKSGIKIGAQTAVGLLYGLIDLAEKIRHNKEIPDRYEDAPRMAYRGYSLGLQKQVGYFPGHKYYDWPVKQQHFPWFYDKTHMLMVLDRLALQRCNLLNLWSGHPFASFCSLEEYPEMLEVSEEEFHENEKQLQWLSLEAEKRGIQIFVHFYNIHMPAPLAKARGWKVLSGTAHEDIRAYTSLALKDFVRRYPQLGLAVCMGEVIEKDSQETWLKDVILKSISEAAEEHRIPPPPIILRGHQFERIELLHSLKKAYPNVLTMHKHNSENLVSSRTDPDNLSYAKASENHVISLHLCANLEPFTWGSPTFMQETVDQMLRQGARGLHVYPLRFWDWPNSPHTEAAGDQLYEHFIWWSGWGRYAWDPKRDTEEESRYWKNEIAFHFGIEKEAAEALLAAFELTGGTLPEIAGQFMLSSGNRQNFALGQFLVPMAFTRLQYHGGAGYSMSQLCGFPLIGERMWSSSPLAKMDSLSKACRQAARALDKSSTSCPYIRLIRDEIVVLGLIAEFYGCKAEACSVYFQSLYGVPGAKEEKGAFLLEKSVSIFHLICAKTANLFRDAGGLHHHREIPLKAEDGYLHWKDCLPKYEEELAIAQSGGIRELLRWTFRKDNG